MVNTKNHLKTAMKLAGVPVLVASLCCLSPVILVALGLGSVSFAASLSDVFYGQYRWAFRVAGLVLLAVCLLWYFRRKRGICTVNQAKRQRNEIVNTVAFALIVAVAGYILWLYVGVHYVGVWLNIWT